MLTSKKLYPIGLLYTSGYIEVEENTFIYFEQRGNPNGPAVICNHGGPGGASRAEMSCWFDPEYYNIILYDQRGTGKSKPSVETPSTDPKQFKDLSVDDMVGDLEKLRQRLNVEQWLVFGGSWGSTLSLYYAEKHPDHVLGLIIFGIFLNTLKEMRIYYQAKEIEERFPILGTKAFNILFVYAKTQGLEIDPDSAESFMKAYYELCVERNDSTAHYLWTAYERFNDAPNEDSLTLLQQIPEVTIPSDRTHAVFENILFKWAFNGFNVLDNILLENLKTINIRIIQGVGDTEAPPIFAQELIDALLKIKLDLWYRFIDGRHSPNSSEVLIETLLDCTDSFKILNTPNYKGTLDHEAEISELSQATILSNNGLFNLSKNNQPDKVSSDYCLLC